MPQKTIIVLAAVTVVAIAAVIVLGASAYTIDQAEQAIVLEFGAPVGDPVTTPGLHFKKPFIQEVRRFDKRLQSWDGDPNQIPTRGRQFISVDTTARWRITDPLVFLRRVQNERGAINRLNDILDSVVRDRISSTDLVEIVRSKDWKVTEDDIKEALVVTEEGEQALLQQVGTGREELVREILAIAQAQVQEYGIELVDIRIKRLGYVEEVQRRVYERMISERQRIAEQFRSEGQGRSAEILGQTQRELAEISSRAKRQAEIIRGQADGVATRVYNEAYGKNPEFYAFYRTMQSYTKTLGGETALIIGADSEYFRFLRELGTAAR
ncbi:MAG TPA: protease modulator HflC [Planctomycetota bacterium]|nr:protease modulator HflC [Planctomycetota bacterium]